MEEEPGNFTGYAVDLIEKLSQELGFKYQIQIVKDNKYGSPDNKTGQWNGMIGDILAGVSSIYFLQSVSRTHPHARTFIIYLYFLFSLLHSRERI